MKNIEIIIAVYLKLRCINSRCYSKEMWG